MTDPGAICVFFPNNCFMIDIQPVFIIPLSPILTSELIIDPALIKILLPNLTLFDIIEDG